MSSFCLLTTQSIVLTTLKVFENIGGEWENADTQHFFCFPQCLLACHGKKSSFWIFHLQMLSIWTSLKFCCLVKSWPFPKRQNLDSSKLKEFADDILKFDINGRKFSKWVENTVGKKRNCSLWAISPFPTVFSKHLYCRQVKTRACLGKG